MTGGDARKPCVKGIGHHPTCVSDPLPPGVKAAQQISDARSRARTLYYDQDVYDSLSRDHCDGQTQVHLRLAGAVVTV